VQETHNDLNNLAMKNENPATSALRYKS